MQFIDEKQRKNHEDCLTYDKPIWQLFENNMKKYLKKEKWTNIKIEKTSSYLCDNSIHITFWSYPKFRIPPPLIQN